MVNLPQRWLSLSGICTVLNLTPTQINRLYKDKLLVRIGPQRNATKNDYRYLDPTPEYAERLRLAAAMLSKNPIVPDLPATFILTVREVAEIMGWSLRYARTVVVEKKVPFFKAKNKACLFTVSDVRDLIFKRNGRGRFSKQLSPFLLPEIIAYQRRFQAAEEAIVPTDAVFERDAELQKKIRWMMKQPQRQAMLADFLEKMELAKQVVKP